MISKITAATRNRPVAIVMWGMDCAVILPAMNVPPQNRAHKTSFIYAQRDERDVETPKLAHHMDGLALLIRIQVRYDSLHQTIDTIFICPRNVWSNDQIRMVQIKQGWAVYRGFD